MTKIRLIVFWAKLAAILFTLPTAAQSLNQHQADLDAYLKALSENNKVMTAVYVTEKVFHAMSTMQVLLRLKIIVQSLPRHVFELAQ